jgi:hypothetical protein
MLEVAPISDQTDVITKERPVHQGMVNLQSSFRGEGNVTRLDLPTIFLRMLHQFLALTVNLVDLTMELLL